MKTRSKALLLVLCAVLLVAASVLGTMAYLTDSEAVTNTFTVGKVGITLDETDVDLYGVKDSNTRVKENEYKLIPGHTYVKDPIVHVDADSEDCYIFVKVENGISAYENSDNTIAAQITTNDWTPLGGVSNVYYKVYTKDQEDKDLEVFQSFKVADNADEVEIWSYVTPENTKINVTAYAVQKDGFADAKAAWDATFGASNP